MARPAVRPEPRPGARGCGVCGVPLFLGSRGPPFAPAHRGTGREIYEQTSGAVTHFVMASSTGGTIMGVGSYLKERNPKTQIVLADPEKSHLKGCAPRPKRAAPEPERLAPCPTREPCYSLPAAQELALVPPCLC